MRSDIVVFGATALAWSAFGYKLHHLRQRAADPDAVALRALVVVLGLLALVFTLLPTVVAASIDAVTGLSGVARLLSNVLAMVTCLAILGWLLYLSRPAEAARIALERQAKVLGAVLALVLMLFALDHPPVVPEREFDGAHVYPFLGYLAYVQVGLASLSLRYANRVEPPMMRLGLRMVSTAIGLGLLFVAAQLVYQLEADRGIAVPGSLAVVRPIYVAAAVLFLLGITLPSLGPRVGLEALWWRVERWRATRSLKPLWSLMTGVCSDVVLDRALLLASPVGARLAAERLPVEIHDGWLHLRSYLTRDDARTIDELACSRGLAETSPEVAAARVLVAVRRKRSGQAVERGVVPVERLVANSTLVSDIRFLCGVSRRLRSRFVQEALTRTDRATHGRALTGAGNLRRRFLRGRRPG